MGKISTQTNYQPHHNQDHSDLRLPIATETEKAVLSSLILHGEEAINEAIAKGLNDDVFFSPSHKKIYRAILAVHEREWALTPNSISDYLNAHHDLESVGGIAYLASLIDGKAPGNEKIPGLIKQLEEARYKRVLAKFGNSIVERACNGASPTDLSNLKELYPIYTQDNESGLLQSWGEFSKQVFPSGDAIIHELNRGEICLLAAVTNIGKSTLLRNLMLSLACGRPFAPIVERTIPRKVMLLDFETRKLRLQRDIKKMIVDFSGDERKAIDKNLTIICDEEINEEPLSLSNPHHLNFVRMLASSVKPDLLIIDTVSAAFCIRDENSNAEVGNSVFKPLIKLARDIDAAIILAHHIGKSGSEDGRSSEKAYRARGASSFATYPAMVINLSNDPAGVGLSLAKVKGDSFPDEVLALDREARWFKRTWEAPVKPRTVTDLIMDIMSDGEMRKTGDLIALLEGKASKTAIAESLKNAAESGKLTRHKQGLYQIPSLPTPD